MSNLITPLSSSKVNDELDTYVADDEIEVDSPSRVDNIHATLQHHYTMATSSSRYRVLQNLINQTIHSRSPTDDNDLDFYVADVEIGDDSPPQTDGLHADT